MSPNKPKDFGTIPPLLCCELNEWRGYVQPIAKA